MLLLLVTHYSVYWAYAYNALAAQSAQSGRDVSQV